MRTFEQYIDESYSFRLGGSQKKGFDQNYDHMKPFGELENGDTIYIYSGEHNTIRAVTFLEFDEPRINELVFNYKEKSKNGLESRTIMVWIEKTDLKLFSIAMNGNLYCTNKKLLLEFLNKSHKGSFDEDDIIDSTVNESYNFRLGGSQKKGFNQIKRFSDLNKGDMFYFWNSGFGNQAKEYCLEKMGDYYSKDSITMTYTYGVGRCSVYLPSKDLDNTVSTPDSTLIEWCIATSFEELVSTVREKYNIEIKGLKEFSK